jgi:adenylate kinase
VSRVVVLLGAPGSGKSTVGRFLDDLDARGRCFIARLDVSEAEARRRVAGRERDRHLSDDIAANAAVWRAFREVVVPARRCDLVIDIDTTSAADVAARVVSAVGDGSSAP